MKREIIRSAALALVLAAGAAGCQNVQTTHGFQAENPEATQIQVGVDTQQTVMQRMGSPSTMAAFDQNTWYYVSATQERFAFYRPRTTERTIIAVRFDANNVVSAVDRYGVERGQVIAYDDHATPTRGRELGLLEQIFGNVGSTPPIRTQEAEQGPRRDR
ncbi:MAG: outer membrane protein assembly factor BamE [Hyphomonadaceae bacterium]